MSYDDDPQNPYDPAAPNLEGETPEIEEAIRFAIRSELMRMRVSLPAKVVSKSANGQIVNVQPMLKVRNTDNTLEDLPVIQDVPVVWPGGLTHGLRLPTAVGDLGTLLFCDRALDAFIEGMGSAPADPRDTRLHDYTDPQFFPGLLPKSKQSSDSSSDVVLYNGNTQVRLMDNGKLALKNGTTELLATLSDLAGQLASLAGDLASAKAMVLLPGAPAPTAFPLDPSTILSASQVQTTAQQLKAALDSLKP